MTDYKVKLNFLLVECPFSFLFQSLLIPDYFATGSTSVPFSDTINHLGVTLDCHIYFKHNAANHVRTANF